MEVYDIDDGSSDPEGYLEDLLIVEIDGSPVTPSTYVEVFGVGPHTVTLEATDDCGQTDQCIANIYVQNAPPYIECQPYTYEYPDPDGCVTVYMY